jgi:hypothetical protein
METTEIKYPVGEQDFEKIRKGNYLYVDKTDLVYKLANSVSYAFLSRPRRFGKTLLTSTLHYYFDGRKDLFTGLAMEKLEKDWIQYPVLHFDISLAKDCSPKEMTKELHKMLNEYDNIYGIHTTSTPGSRLNELIRHIYHTTGKQVVLLIDEYDAPVMKVLHKQEVVKEVRERMSNFYTALKPNDKYLRFVFITGVSTFSQMGIFSELNNLTKITGNNDFAAICGITQEELTNNFNLGIESIAREKNWTKEEVLARLKDKYDGYHFSNTLVDIYNPYSLLNAFYEKQLGDYWFDSGTSSSLVNAFQQYIGDFNLELDKIDSSGRLKGVDVDRGRQIHRESRT